MAAVDEAGLEARLAAVCEERVSTERFGGLPLLQPQSQRQLLQQRPPQPQPQSLLQPQPLVQLLPPLQSQLQLTRRCGVPHQLAN